MGFKLLGRTIFPALVSALSPLTLVKQGLAYTFGLNVSALRTSLDPFYATRVAVNVLDFGAKGDWNGTTGTDDSAAFQAAIDTIAAIGGGTVYVPAVAKAYRLNAQIIIKPKVRLVGASVLQMPNIAAATIDEYYGGHCLAITWGAGTDGVWNTSTGCAIRMQLGTSFSGINIVYPGQQTDLTKLPVNFPPCIAGFDYEGAGGVIENVWLANAWKAIYFPIVHYQLQIRNVGGGLFSSGVVLNGAAGADTLTNVWFAATNYLQRAPGAGFGVGNNGGLWDYIFKNGIGFDIGWADDIRFIDCAIGDCQTAIRFGSAPTGLSTAGLAQYAYGNWIGGLIEGACFGVYVNAPGGGGGLNSHGFHFTNTRISTSATFAASHSISIVMDQPNSAAVTPLTEYRGKLTLDNCTFWGNGSYVANTGPLNGVVAATGGDLFFTNCKVQTYQFYTASILSGTPVINWSGGLIEAPVAGQTDPSFVNFSLGAGSGGALYWSNTEIRGGVSFFRGAGATTVVSGGANTVATIAGNSGDFTLGDGLKNSTNLLAANPAIFRNYRKGLTLSAAGSTGTFGIAAGVAVNSTNAAFMSLATAYTKTTSAWAVGTGNGGIDTGAVANSTWYHVHLIKRLDTGVADVLFSLSATAPTLPTNYTVFRRIGSMKTDGAAKWIAFIQDNNAFRWATVVADISQTNPGTTAVTRTLTVPTGVRVQADIVVGGQGNASDSGPGAIFISDLSLTDQVASQAGAVDFFVYAGTNSGSFGFMGRMSVMTSTSAQVRTRCQLSSGTNAVLIINTHGWTDPLGDNS